jgi:hypothetical protein
MDFALAMFVDETLAGTLEEQWREQDFDPARDRDECREPWINHGWIRACNAYRNAVAANRSTRVLALLRGNCREKEFVRDLCRGRYRPDARGRLIPQGQGGTPGALPVIDVRNQVRVQPVWRRSPVADVIVNPGPNAVAYEFKSVYAPAYVEAIPAGGGVRIRREKLRNLVLRHVSQVHRQMNFARMRAGARHRPVPGLPARVDLVYQFEGLGTLPPDIQRGIRSFVAHIAQRADVRVHVL